MNPTLRRLLRRAPGLMLGLAILLQGCAGLIPGKQDATAPAEVPAGEGSVLMRKGRPGIVIGAPLGAYDRTTAVIAGDLARLTGFGLVVVRADGRGSDTDRVPVTSARLDADAPGPGRVSEAYRRRVVEAAQGPLALYVEVYGNAPGGKNAERVEITTVGLSRDDAWRLRTLFELIRDSRVDAPAVPRLEVQVESVDRVRGDPLAVAPRALHIDLPGPARTTYREIYTQVLGAFLSESVTFLMPRPR